MATTTEIQTSPTKFAPADWHTSNTLIQTSAERQREITHRIRQEGNQTRNETDVTTKWRQYNNNTFLSTRIGNISEWKANLQQVLSKTEKEIDQLSFTKRITEYALAAKEMPMKVVMECLSFREDRVAIDLVRDEVEAELHKEVEVLVGIQNLLHQRIEEAFGQLHLLHNCHQKLCLDITDKSSALSIDSDCFQLDNTSHNVALQIDPTRIKRGIVNPIQWESFSSNNTTTAEEEISRSSGLREAINQTIQQTTNDLESQWIATNYALRRRIHEVKQAIKELEWQKEKTEAEIAKVEDEINRLTVSFAEKMPPMKVAHTRLENRTYRPNVELCRDNPQYGLVEEIAEISSSKKQLDEKLSLAKQGLGTLQRTLQRIIEDLSVKTHSLKLDEQCTKVREQLSSHPKTDQLPLLVKAEAEQQN